MKFETIPDSPEVIAGIELQQLRDNPETWASVQFDTYKQAKRAKRSGELFEVASLFHPDTGGDYYARYMGTIPVRLPVLSRLLNRK